MQLYDPEPTATGRFGSCCSLDDLHDARRVAAAIDIPHYILNFERQFDEQVVVELRPRVRLRPHAAALRALQQRPEVRDAARARRAASAPTAVATGHYARVERDAATGRYLLRRGVDPAKDQAYFLFSLTQEQLARAVFPVGDRAEGGRPRLRARREPAGRRQAGQPGDLLHPRRRLREVRRRRTRPRQLHATGAIVDESGRVLGRHEGIHRFTVGQRKGSGCRAPADRRRRRCYVLALKPADQQVVVGPKAALERTTLTASGVNWIRRAAGRRCASPRRFAIAISPRPPRCAVARRAAAPRSSSTSRRSRSRPAGGGVLRGRRGRRRRLDRLTDQRV